MTETADITPADTATAIKLLAAAKELGYEPSVVEGPYESGFRVPVDVADHALGAGDDNDPAYDESVAYDDLTPVQKSRRTRRQNTEKGE